MVALVEAAAPPQARTDRFNLVLDTVWWRRVVYFVSLFLLTFATLCSRCSRSTFKSAASPISTIGRGDRSDGRLAWSKASCPASPNPGSRRSCGIRGRGAGRHRAAGEPALQRPTEGRICDRARAAWSCDVARAIHNVGRKAGTIQVERLQLTGQRHALAVTTLVFAALAIGSFKLSAPSLGIAAAIVAILSALLWTWRMLRPPGQIDPAKPGVLLSLARATRTSPGGGRRVPVRGANGAAGRLSRRERACGPRLGHRATFDLLSTGGEFCEATEAVRKQSDSRLAQGSTPDAEWWGGGGREGRPRREAICDQFDVPRDRTAAGRRTQISHPPRHGRRPGRRMVRPGPARGRRRIFGRQLAPLFRNATEAMVAGELVSADRTHWRSRQLRACSEAGGPVAGGRF